MSLSRQQEADVAIVQRLLTQTRKGTPLSADDKRVLLIIARRAPLTQRDALTAMIERMMARDGVSAS